MRNFANKLITIAGVALLWIGSAEASQAFVDLALYRPSTGQFFVRSSLNGSVTAIQFGAPGDKGLLCRLHSNTHNGGDTLLLYRNGIWFQNYAGDGATVDAISTYGAPTDQPLCGNYAPDQQSSLGLFRSGLWFLRGSSTATFAFGQVGDVAVHIGAKNFGDATIRQNMVYGVYRAGIWYLVAFGNNSITGTIQFGGLSQDVPLLIPHWNGTGPYSLAIFRDGIWYIKPEPNGPSIVTVQFGAPGDIPLVRGAH